MFDKELIQKMQEVLASSSGLARTIEECKIFVASLRGLSADEQERQIFIGILSNEYLEESYIRLLLDRQQRDDLYESKSNKR